MTAPEADALKAKMRAFVADAHAAQSRNGGRVPYAAHVLSVAEILRDALVASRELDADPGLALDLYLAALGHDLYEDTKATPEQVRASFGARVDTFIEGMTNRAGDHDRAAYVARMRDAEEGVRLIKIADLVDNVTSCAYGIHDLGRDWVRGTFLPIATEMSKVVVSVQYPRFPEAARLLLGWLDFALHRLQANLAISRALDQRDPRATADAAAAFNWDDWDGDLGKKDYAESVRLTQEREWREGALVKGGHAFPPRPIDDLPGRGGPQK